MFFKSSDTLFDEQSRRVAVRHFLKFGDLELEETSGGDLMKVVHGTPC